MVRLGEGGGGRGAQRFIMRRGREVEGKREREAGRQKD